MSTEVRRDAAWLRRCFARPRSDRPVTLGDGSAVHDSAQLRDAAVLVPVVDRGHLLTVLFTRRTAHLNDHAGQISFPGGRAEEADRSPERTALRETHEEIGLGPAHVEVLGRLSQYVTVTAYRVTPVVGLITPPFELRPDEFEVDEVFEVPLGHLLDERNHQQNTVTYKGWQRRYFALPYQQYYIWGATAGMLMNLHAFLAAA